MENELLIELDTIVYAFIGFSVFVWLLFRFFYVRRTVNETIEGKNKIILKISIPRNNEKSPLAAEQLYSALHGIVKSHSKAKETFSFEIVGNTQGIFFTVVTDVKYKRFVENQIFAQYPEADIDEIKDYAEQIFTKPKYSLVKELGLVKHFYLPFRTFTNFDVDPLASITATMAKLAPEEEIWLQVVVRPMGNVWQTKGKAVVDSRKELTDVEGKKVSLQSGESEEIREIERKNTKVGFQFVVRLMCRSNTKSVEALMADIVASFRQFQTPHLNSIVVKSAGKSIFTYLRYLVLGRRLDDTLNAPTKYFRRFLHERQYDVINIEELASLFHLPNKTVQTPNIAWALSKKSEYPINLPTHEQGARVFGMTDYRGQPKFFGVRDGDRRRHMYVLGKTGTGKSTLMKNMIVADIYDGKGVGVLDPHGDLIEDIMTMIPPHRVKDVILFDPADIEYPVGLNLLKLEFEYQRDVVADGIVEVFKKEFGDSWGPRLHYILLNAILTLLECQNVSLLAVMRILSDPNYRKFLLKQLKDPIIKNFWDVEFANIEKNPKLLAEALAPIQNKVGRFISSPMIRNMIAQVKAPIDISKIMDEGKILLVNLSQGKIGEENSALLGGLFVTKIFSSAMGRVNTNASDRRDFYLYVDEFQNFATKTFIKILSEARKYGLNLIVAHQYIDQVMPEVTDAIFGNVGTMATFTVGPKDAGRLEKEFKPYLDYEDLVNLQKYSFVTKLMIDGSQSKPFTAKSILGNFKIYENNADVIRHHSREQYSMPRAEIEEKINKWSAQVYNKEGNLIQNSSPHKNS